MIIQAIQGSLISMAIERCSRLQGPSLLDIINSHGNIDGSQSSIHELWSYIPLLKLLSEVPLECFTKEHRNGLLEIILRSEGMIWRQSAGDSRRLRDDDDTRVTLRNFASRLTQYGGLVSAKIKQWRAVAHAHVLPDDEFVRGTSYPPDEKRMLS